MNPWLARSVVIRQLDIPPLAKLLLHSLNSRTDLAGICWPALTTLELDTGLSHASILEYLHYCRSHGYLTARRTTHNIYTLTLTESLLRRPPPTARVKRSAADLSNPAKRSGADLVAGQELTLNLLLPVEGAKEGGRQLINQTPDEGRPAYFTLGRQRCPGLHPNSIRCWFTHSYLDGDTLVVPVPAAFLSLVAQMCSSYENVKVVAADRATLPVGILVNTTGR